MDSSETSIFHVSPLPENNSLMEILFSLSDPEKIYLHIGAPDASLLPVDLINKTSIMQQDLISSLQYGPSQGSESVREELSQFLSREYKSMVDKDHLLLTSGASQSFYNLIPIFTNSETVFIMENPTYFLAWKMLVDHGIKSDSIIGISSDDEGLDVDALEAYLLSTLVPVSRKSVATKNRKFKFLLYLVPTFGNPTGASLTMKRREKLIDLARKYDILVVCDDVYHLIYFENQMPPDRLVSLDLKSVKEAGNVISNCSFSKLFSPGFRLGWIEAAPTLLNQLKNSGILNSGGCSNHFSSFLMKPILRSCGFSSHLQGIRKEYQGRRDLLLHEFKKLPSQFTVSSPKGGFFIWIIDTTKTLDSTFLLEKISLMSDIDYKVTFTPGNSFSANNAHGHCMRVSFGMYKGNELITGAQRLVKLLTQEFDQSKDLIYEIFEKDLDSGSVSYTFPNLTIDFERFQDTLVLSLDKLNQLKRSLSIETFKSETKKVKLSENEKSEIIKGIEMINSDSLKAKIVINRTYFKELSFMESIVLSIKDMFKKFKNKC